VERDEILEGNAKLEVSRTVAQTAGPAIGGGLIDLLTAPIAIAADAVSFVASALFVWRIRRPETAPDRHRDEHGQPRGSLRSEVTAGLRYVLGNRYLRSIAACTGTSNLGSSMAFATLLVYLVRELEMQPGVIGLVLGIGNVGAIAGAFAANRIGHRFGVGPTIVGTVVLFSAAAFLIPLAPKSWPAPFLVASGALTGFSTVVYNISQVSFRQAITPPRMQGRMNATMRFIVWGTIPVGGIIGGILATTLGLSAPLWIGAIVGSLAILPVLLGPVRNLRQMPEPVEEAPEPETLEAAVAEAAEREVGQLGVLGAPMPSVDAEELRGG
jgi:MFS family permease